VNEYCQYVFETFKKSGAGFSYVRVEDETSPSYLVT
jgi:hypothetical protein